MNQGPGTPGYGISGARIFLVAWDAAMYHAQPNVTGMPFNGEIDPETDKPYPESKKHPWSPRGDKGSSRKWEVQEVNEHFFSEKIGYQDDDRERILRLNVGESTAADDNPFGMFHFVMRVR